MTFLMISLGMNTNASNNPGPSNDSLYAIVLPQLNGPNYAVDSAELKIIDGVVFYQGPMWKPEEDFEDTEKWSEYRDEYIHRTGKSDAYRLLDLNIEAKHLYLSGCLNSVDIGSPMWGGGDGYRNFFLGDTAGTLSIGYRSGITDVIPLVFGYTAWWHENYQSNFEPFRSDAVARDQLNEVLCVVNGLSFGSIRDPEEVDRGTFLIKNGLPVSKSRTDSINGLLVYSSDPYPEQRQQAIESLRNTFYTSLEDISDSIINKTPPEVHPADFPGPKVTFTGSPIATLLTRIYYENSMQILGRIDADGMVHESEKSADNYQGYAEMADASGRTDKAVYWREQADRLNGAMEAYYPVNIEPWGDVWDPKKNAIFSYVNSTLAPACIGMDYYGFDVMNLLPKEWADRIRRTYKMQLTRNRPEFAASAGIGYGQCYITQTGLLMDEMKDADKMVEWMVRLCFTPRLKHPYRVPEASVISEDGSTWRRWGDLGNLYQMVDVVHTIHLMIGIDDIDPSQLTLMPRLTKDIHEMEIEEWPVRIQSHDKSLLADISMQMEIDPDAGEITCHLSSSHPIDQARIRLGPFPASTGSLKVLQNEKDVPFTRINSGDSGWVWIRFGGESLMEYDFRLYFKSGDSIETANNEIDKIKYDL